MEPVAIRAGMASRRRGGDAAAGPDDLVAARPAAAAWPARLYRDRRALGRAAPGETRPLALAGAGLCLLGPRAAGAVALRRADKDRAGAHALGPAEPRYTELAQSAVRVPRIFADARRAVEHLYPRHRRRDRRHPA